MLLETNLILVLVLAFCCCMLTTTCISIEGELFYIYDWSNITSLLGNGDAEMFGAGPSINATRGSHNTDQFRLFDLMYHRALRDPRRTIDPNLATTFLVPYDFGVDSLYIYPNKDGSKHPSCRIAANITATLLNSTYFQAKGGHDHLLIVGINYCMDHFLLNRACKPVLHACANCTKLAIDDYSFLYPNNSGVVSKGDYWAAVPFPSNFHWSPSVQLPFPWDEAGERPLLVSYIGSLKSHFKPSRILRGAIAMYCSKHSHLCRHSSYTGDPHNERKALLGHKQQDPHRDLSLKSVFCFIPTGDMPTRKGLFDALMCGCIPVTFDALTATQMYTWHWSQDLWKQIVIEIPKNETNGDSIHSVLFADPVLYLKELYDTQPELIQRKQALLRDHVFKLQYSLEAYVPGSSWPLDASTRQPMRDAYDISMDLVLGWHTGRHSRFRNATVPPNWCFGDGVLVNNECIFRS